MANNSADIRELMNLLENFQIVEPTLLEGWVDTLKNKIGNHLGSRERTQLAKKLVGEWSTWLGQTRRKGTIEDMHRFMTTRIGFKPEDVETVFGSVNLDNTSEKPDTKTPTSSNPADVVDPEEGTPLPTDLNTKLSDYKDLKPGEKPANTMTGTSSNVKPVQDANTDREYKIYQENPKNYMNGNEWDDNKIRRRIAKMKPGEELHLGKRKFRKTFPGDAGTKFKDPKSSTTETIDEASSNVDSTTDKENTILSSEEVAEIMDASAARINDEYLYNGPANDKADLAAQQMMAMGNRRSSFRIPGASNLDAALGKNTGDRKGSGQYDTKEMLDVLQAVNYNKDRVPSLERKVSKATSISEMSDQDMQELALIGFAFLRARS